MAGFPPNKILVILAPHNHMDASKIWVINAISFEKHDYFVCTN